MRLNEIQNVVTSSMEPISKWNAPEFYFSQSRMFVFKRSITEFFRETATHNSLLRDILLILENRMAMIFHPCDLKYYFYCDEGMLNS